MESWVIDAARYAPVPIASLVVMAWIVKTFLAHMAKRDEMLGTISDNCHNVQEKSITAMDRNTEALGRVEVLLDRINGNAVTPR